MREWFFLTGIMVELIILKGGVGQIAQKLVAGIEKAGGKIQYQSRVTKIITEQGQAIGVQLANGKIYHATRIVSNATRWDTFTKLLPEEKLPKMRKIGNNAIKNRLAF